MHNNKSGFIVRYFTLITRTMKMKGIYREGLCQNAPSKNYLKVVF